MCSSDLCNTSEQDVGSHTVCVVLTDDFLEFSKSKGNDLSSPMPAYGFPGLKGGERWCLCARRWLEAYQAGKAPKVILRATHQRALEVIAMDILREFAFDLH